VGKVEGERREERGNEGARSKREVHSLYILITTFNRNVVAYESFEI
jgi:hypothetical protein